MLSVISDDNNEDISWLCNKIANLRIFGDKTGVMNDSNEGVIAPLVFTILSAILIYGLSDKIYI